MTYNPKHYPSLATCKALKDAGIGVDENGKILTKACWAGDKIWDSGLVKNNRVSFNVNTLDGFESYPCPDLHEIVVMTEDGKTSIFLPASKSIIDLDLMAGAIAFTVRNGLDTAAIFNSRLIAHNTIP